jgi:hypothetical protein
MFTTNQGTRKYMIKMVRNEPMLDFFDRKAVFKKQVNIN